MPRRRDGSGRGVLGGGPSLAARPRRRRRRGARARARGRVLPRCGEAGRRRAPQRLPGDPSGIRLPVRAGAVRRGRDGSGAHVRGTVGRRHPRHGGQDRGAAPHAGGRRADRARNDAAARGSRAGPPRSGAPRLPRIAQGGGGGRGERDAAGPDGGGARGGVRGSAERGAEGLRGGGGVPREIPGTAAPHRDPGARRLVRARGVPGRARVQHPAAASEAHRGGALARRDARAAAPAERRRHRRRRSGRLSQRRHDRVSARAKRRVLFPGNEHPSPGRAPGDRAGVRGGHRAGAAARGHGTALAGARRHAGAARPRDRVPHHGGGSLQRFPARHGRGAACAGAGRARCAVGRGVRNRERGDAPLRLPDGEADRVGRDPPGGAGADATRPARAGDRGPADLAAVPPARDGRPGVPARRPGHHLSRPRRSPPAVGGGAARSHAPAGRRGGALGRAAARRDGARATVRPSAGRPIRLAARGAAGSRAGRRMSDIVAITSIAAGGDGVGRLDDGRAVFVPRTAPGERVRLRDGIKLLKNFARGELAEVVVPAGGGARVTPPCPHYPQDRCGGCQLQHVAYDAQLQAKRAIVGDALRRIAKLDVPDPEIVEAVEEWRYRAKVSLAVKGGGGRAKAVGFHPYDRPGTVFPLVDCHITDFRLMALWRELKPRLDLLPPRLTRLTLRLDRDGRRHVIAESAGEPWLDAERLRAALPQSDAVVCWWRPADGAARVVAGPATGFPATAFEQVHPEMGLVARRWAVDQLGDLRGAVAWDLYGGIGDTAVQLAAHGAQVVSVDADEQAVEWARGRASERPIRFIAGRAEDVLPTLPDPNVVVVNPPPAGLHWNVTLRLTSQPVAHVIYLSCDPATLARDLHRLRVNYRVTAVRAFDLFPQTAHVETVVVLEGA